MWTGIAGLGQEPAFEYGNKLYLLKPTNCTYLSNHLKPHYWIKIISYMFQSLYGIILREHKIM